MLITTIDLPFRTITGHRPRHFCREVDEQAITSFVFSSKVSALIILGWINSQA